MPVEVLEAKSREELRELIFFPEKLYADDPLWVPPLWSEERETFSLKNPVLAHSDYLLLLARSGGRTAGRILAYVDHAYNDFHRSRLGFFGSFESIQDAEVGRALLGQAERWLADRGMGSVRGPINPISECWGLLYEGYQSPPTFMSPYNPPYYHDLVTGQGYEKVKDLLVYEADATEGYRIPERFQRFRAKLLARRPTLSVRRLDPRNIMRDAEHIGRISNEGVRENWGYVPLDQGEIKAMFRKLRPLADPDAIWFVEDGGLPVGYALGFPDLNRLLTRTRGRLFPFGFVTLLTGVRKLRHFRLFGLAVLPPYHNLGLDVLLYMCLYEALAPRGVHLEANYVLEDNLRIRNALEKLALRQSKIYRVYEKPLRA
jgi:GNAT superfamily N-acetyltransferase